MPTEVIMPKVDMDMAAGTIAQWHVTEGQPVDKGAPLFDIETDKATMEIESPASGTLQFVSAKQGDEIAIGRIIAWIFAKNETLVVPATTPEGAAASGSKPARTPRRDPETFETGNPTDPPSTGSFRATPLARRMAKSAQIDLAAVKGSGPRGRVIRVDIEQAMAGAPKVRQPVAGVDARKIADQLGIAYNVVEPGRMRQIIAQRLSESKATVPHFYLEADCKIDDLIALRTQINTVVGALDGRKVSLNDLLIRACAMALRAVPQANASWAGDSIIQYRGANISVAVAVDGGLVTPVIRDAQVKDVQAISAEMADLGERARAGNLAKREYQGGSFSISNLGMYGVKAFTAIINPPESMILAVGQGQLRIVVGEDGLPETATIMSVTLSCDHRVVDGAVGALWLSHFQRLIENPASLLLK